MPFTRFFPSPVYDTESDDIGHTGTDDVHTTVGAAIRAGGGDADAIHDNVANEISAVAEKTSPISADLLLMEDSADSNVKKRVQVGNLLGSGGGLLSWLGIG